MASIKLIGQAKLQAYGIGKFFGVNPDLDIQKDYVRLYYSPHKLKQAQEKFSNLMTSPPGPIRYDFQGVAVPYTIKSFGLGILGLSVLTFFIGRNM